MFNLWGAHKTFRPKKSYKKKCNGKNDLQEVAKATLGSGDLANAVKVPKGEDLNEWLASNTVDFYNTVNLLYGSITEYCTKHSCPCMSAGDKFEYLWMNPPEIPKPIKCSAPEYIDYLMTWIEKKLNNEELFPASHNTPFPSKFKKELKTIFKRLFRVYAHIYHSHFDQVQKYGEEAHLNTAFKHFLLFVWEFKLIKKDELVPLNSLIIELFGEQYRRLKITSPPHVNNLENSLKLYRNTKEYDKMAGYKDLYTEVDTPLAVLSDQVVEGLAQRARVSLDRARLAIQENKMIVRDAFSQILTEKIQIIMDETGEDVHRARKVLCEQNNDENRAIAYCKHIRILMESGDVDRKTALFVYYNHDRNVELAKKELILQRFMRDQKYTYNNPISREEAMRILSKVQFQYKGSSPVTTDLLIDLSENMDDNDNTRHDTTNVII